MAARRDRCENVVPNRPLGGDGESSEADMPQLARQEARGGGRDSDSEWDSEDGPPDIDSSDDSDDGDDLEFRQDLEGDDSDDDLPPTNWKEVVGPTQIKVDDFVLGIDHPGPNHNLDYRAQALDFFSLILDDNFFQLLVNMTNKYALEERAKALALGKPHGCKWTPTTTPEMKAYISMLIVMGLKNMTEANDIWSNRPLLNDAYLSSIMPKNRYWALSKYLHIADNTGAVLDAKDPNYDPMHKVRPLIDLINARSSAIYKPKQCLSIDEGMIKFKGRHHAKMYMPKKPIKWGFKLWILAEPGTGYALRVEVYEGKARDPVRAARRQQFSLGYDVVDSLSKDYQLKNHIIYMDRFFSSVALAEHLLEQKTYMNSTVMLNRKGLPAAAKTLKLKKDQPCRQFAKGNLLLTTFFDKRQVSHLSTGCQPGLVDNSVKPIDNADYNQFMGGVDLCDQNASYYGVGRRAVKWWKCILRHLLNLSITNAYLVWRATLPPPVLAPALLKKRNQYTAKLFRIDVCEQLRGDYSATQLHKRRRLLPDPGAVLMDPHMAVSHISEIMALPKVCQYCARKGNKTAAGNVLRSRTRCVECDLHLCPTPCFQKHHAELCGVQI